MNSVQEKFFDTLNNSIGCIHIDMYISGGHFMTEEIDADVILQEDNEFLIRDMNDNEFIFNVDWIKDYDEKNDWYKLCYGNIVLYLSFNG